MPSLHFQALSSGIITHKPVSVHYLPSISVNNPPLLCFWRRSDDRVDKKKVTCVAKFVSSGIRLGYSVSSMLYRSLGFLTRIPLRTDEHPHSSWTQHRSLQIIEDFLKWLICFHFVHLSNHSVEILEGKKQTLLTTEQKATCIFFLPKHSSILEPSNANGDNSI